MVVPLRQPSLTLALFAACLLSLWGCAGLSPCPSATADKLAEHAGLQKQFIQSGNFELLTYSRTTAPGAALTIYIEGDGSAWRTRRCLSSDPTPKNPVALKLALLDPAENVVYLARPCQYVIKAGKGNNCSTGYWSTKIFSPPVIEAINQACSIMKKQAGAREIHLVGYSGGGAVAVLTAARRDDILSIRTIAGNLDHQEVCRQHHISPLIGSLNAIDAAEVIKNIPQIHFSGSRDRIIPPAIVKRFIARQTEPRCSKIVLVRNVDHHKGWQEQWPTLLRMPLPCTLPTPDRE